MIKFIISISLGLLICGPFFALVVHGITGSSDVFTFLAINVLPDYIINSLYLGLSVCILATFIGVGGAWCVVHHRFFGSRTFEWLLLLPMAFPSYIVAYAYTDLWGTSSLIPIRSMVGAIFVMTLCFYPYVYLFARTGFLKQLQNTNQLDAGKLLGASPLEQFLNITWPNARPFIMIGVTLVLMEVLVDYGTVSYFNIKVFSTGIYNAWTGYGDTVAAARLSLILLGFILIILMIERQNRKAMRFFVQGTESRKKPHLTDCKNMKGFLMMAFCFCPVFLGFVVPTIILIDLAMDHTAFYATWGVVFNTIKLGLIVGLLSLVLTYGFVVMKRKSQSHIINALNFLSGFGYALPGIVLGLGLLIVAQWIGVVGSLVFLIAGYLIRFWTIPMQSIEAGFDKISPNIDHATQLMRQGKISEFWYIRLPLLWPAFLSGFLIVFVDVIKELPLTLVMRPLNYDTLAVRVYHLAADERLTEAALPSLIIMISGLIPVIILSRLIKRV